MLYTPAQKTSGFETVLYIFTGCMPDFGSRLRDKDVDCRYNVRWPGDELAYASRHTLCKRQLTTNYARPCHSAGTFSDHVDIRSACYCVSVLESGLRFSGSGQP